MGKVIYFKEVVFKNTNGEELISFNKELGDDIDFLFSSKKKDGYSLFYTSNYEIFEIPSAKETKITFINLINLNKNLEKALGKDKYFDIVLTYSKKKNLKEATERSFSNMKKEITEEGILFKK